jgi:hypothetical protein
MGGRRSQPVGWGGTAVGGGGTMLHRAATLIGVYRYEKYKYFKLVFLLVIKKAVFGAALSRLHTGSAPPLPSRLSSQGCGA